MNNLDKPTTLSITNHGLTVSVSFDHSDITIGEMFEAFKAAMVGITFSEEQVREYVIQLAYEWENMTDN
jgi:hypothetical protein